MIVQERGQTSTQAGTAETVPPAPSQGRGERGPVLMAPWRFFSA